MSSDRIHPEGVKRVGVPIYMTDIFRDIFQHPHQAPVTAHRTTGNTK